jgi:hypothetical protein
MASSTTSTEDAAAPLSFADFLEKMKDPAAADLVRNIKGFIRHFDERSTKHVPNLDTDSASVQNFFIRMESLFRAHPTWQGSGPEVIDQAIEGLEKYVMSKIWPRTFAASAEDRDQDERYSRLAQALSFVNLTTLMGGNAEVIPDEGLVASSIAELTKMDKYKAPRDKLLCLVNVKTLVEDIVGEAVRRGASIGGADAFFPVFLLVVVHARLPRLASNIDYIRKFRARSRLNGQFDYMLCNLESAAMYLDTADWQHLGVTRDYFLQRLADAGIPEAAMELKALGEQQKEEEHLVMLGGQESDHLDKGGMMLCSELTSAETSKQQPLLTIDVPETLGGESGADLLENNSNSKDGTAISAAAAAATDGLTPLGAGPQTPVLMKKQLPTTENSLVEQPSPTNNEPPTNKDDTTAVGAVAEAVPPVDQQQQSESGVNSSAAQVVVDAMVAEGTPLVLEEEAEGRLQQRHPWIYAAAEDLNIADVRCLLAEYRDLVLKYEAVTLSIQQQVGQGVDINNIHSRSTLSNHHQGPVGRSGGAAATASGQGSGSISESAGALIQKLTSWGASRTPSGRQIGVDGESSEAAAALQGKTAGATGVDTRLLHSLFGSPSGQQKQERQPQLDLLGDLETEVKLESNENNNSLLDSPALGLIEETQQAPPTAAEITESLI